MIKLRILLADSDQENTKKFKTYINRYFPDFKIAASLNSIAGFIDKVKVAQPQLVLADIRFFGGMGYQVIRDAHEIFPDLRFIVYATYDDVEYIQKITEFGIIDYIYKPVKPADLERSLKNAAQVFTELEQIKQKEEILFDDYTSNIPIFRNKFLTNLVGGYIENEFEIQNSFRYFGIELDPNYCVMIARIDHFKKIILAFDEKEKHLLVYKILTIVNAKLKQLKNGIAFIDNLNAIIILLGKSIDRKEIVALGSEIRDLIYVQTKQAVTVGIGKTYEKNNEICISYREADAAFRYRGFLGYGTVIPIEFAEPKNYITYRYPVIKEEKLVYAAVAGQYEYCEGLLRQIMEALRQSGNLPEYLLAKIIMDIVIAINRYASENKIIMGDQFTTFFSSKEIFAIKTIDDAYAYMTKSLKTFCSFIVHMREDKKKELVELTKNYIGQNYTQSIHPLSLAYYARTTPEFLQNSFLELEKRTIFDYLIAVRITKAKEIIAATGEDDESVSAKVGYDDVKRFRMAFKQLEGIHPHEYRGKR